MASKYSTNETSSSSSVGVKNNDGEDGDNKDNYNNNNNNNSNSSNQKRTPIDPSGLSGRWEGKSLSEKNDPTYWKESTLNFKVVSDVEAEITGQGISFWRSKRISFKVSGTLNLFTKEMVIRKTHTGDYTNTVEYKTIILPNKGIISGEYASGVIVLKHVSKEDMENAEVALTGMWGGESSSQRNEPTTWTETILKFERNTDDTFGLNTTTGRITGHGLSLWRNLQIEFIVEGTYNWQTKEISLRKQHLGRYTNTVNYDGIVLPENGTIEGQYQNGTIHLERLEPLDLPSIEDIRKMSMTDEQREEIKRREEQGRKRAAKARQIESLLSGIWEGESIDSDNNVTLWTETGIRFKLNPVTMEGTIDGEGVSEWREMSIDFSVKGEFNWNTREINLHKQHKGRYTNRIQYSGWLRERGGGNIGGGSGSKTSSNADTSGSGSSKSSSPTSTLIRSLVNSNLDDIINSKKGWKIEGKYAKGVISLTKRRDFSNKGGFSFASMSRQSDYSRKNDEYEEEEGGEEEEDMNKKVLFVGDEMDGKSNNNTNNYNKKKRKDDNKKKSSTFDADDLRLQKYEMFLAGMLSSGRQLNAKDQYNLATFRKQNSITEDEHWRVIRNIGYSKGDFNALLANDGDNNDADDKDTCKICFTEKINAVILPCGHFALCIDCAKNLLRRNPRNTKCPICRNAVTNITQIYKA